MPGGVPTATAPDSYDRRADIPGKSRRFTLFRLGGPLAECPLGEGGGKMDNSNSAPSERDGIRPTFRADTAGGGVARSAGEAATRRADGDGTSRSAVGTAAKFGTEPSSSAGGRTGVRLGRLVPISAAFALLSFAAGCSALLPAIQDRGLARQELPPIPHPVQMPPPVPKPKPGQPVETWSVSVEDVPVRELLFALARDAAVDIDVDPGIEERVTMNAVDEPLPSLIHRISRHADLRVEVEDGVLVVRRDEPVLRTYPIDYVPLDRETETVNEVGTGVGEGIESPSGEENGSAANVKARTEHRFWDALVESVRGVLGEAPDAAASVFAHRETSLIAVRASAAVHREVAGLLDRILASARRQVLIEATIVEVELDDRFRAGVDLSRVFGSAGIESRLLSGNLGTPPFAGLSIPDLSLTIRLLGEFGDVQVLSTPLVMALNNQTAIVKIAENRVFFTSEVRTETNETTIERNVQTKLHTVPVGLILLVTPSVAADDEIILKIRPTVTRESGFVVDPNPELASAGVVSRIPEIAVREIESVLRLRSGEVAVLGGLMREEAREDTAGVPVLSRLPGIGAAFRYRDRNRDKTELIVFLRPTVIRDPNLAGDLGKYRRWWPDAGGPVAPNRSPRPLGRTAPGPAGVASAALAPFGRDGERRLRIDRSRARNPADGLVDRAWTALRRGDHRTARAAYLEVLDTRPEDALAGLATAALREGRTGEARAWYLRLATLDPKQEVARTMSFVLDRSEDPAAREREVARRVSLAPETAWLQVALGNALAAQGRWEAANEAYRAARRAAPSHPDPAYNLAVSADRRARPRLALAHYRDALDLAALSPPAFDVRAVHERAGALARLEP